jgi:hypothetical protein
MSQYSHGVNNCKLLDCEAPRACSRYFLDTSKRIEIWLNKLTFLKFVEWKAYEWEVTENLTPFDVYFLLQINVDFPEYSLKLIPRKYSTFPILILSQWQKFI